MKKIAYINLGNFGSTGTIIRGIAQRVERRGFHTLICYPGSRYNKEKQKNDYIICSEFFSRVFGKLAYYSGRIGGFSFLPTCRLIHKLKRFQPDIIHLHNIHNSYINHKLLFKYIKKSNIQVVWTLHDCWAFTGRCPHFTLLGCSQWNSGCNQCVYPSDSYPASKVNNSAKMWKKKKEMFTAVPKMQIVTPAYWLEKLVKESYLNKYSVVTIHNGIDMNIFKPNTNGKVRRHENYVVLGVSFGWSEKKGIDVFIALAKMLPANYQIILVGTDEKIDKLLPENIISIHKTNKQEDLAEIYANADVFFNPSREEVLCLVNIEALACGTPVVTFNSGGAPECVDKKSGIVLEENNADNAYIAIRYVCEKKNFLQENCIAQARKFSNIERFDEYCNLYEELLK